MATINGPDCTTATDRLRNQASKVTKDLQEMGSIATDAVHESVEQVRESATQYYEHGRETAHRIERPFEQFIRDKPFKSVLIAVGIGMFLGRFWIRH